MATKIEWTDTTWNPIIGCSKCSPGCANCYAEDMAKRQTYMRPGCEYVHVMKFDVTMNNSGRTIWKPTDWNGKTLFVRQRLKKPTTWKKPRKVFVCSMGDFAHPTVSQKWQNDVLDVISENQRHTFQILTKRPAILLNVLHNAGYGADNLLRNLWIGTTVCNQQEADQKIPKLLEIPAAVRFVSIEPMLGPVDLDRLEEHIEYGNGSCMTAWTSSISGKVMDLWNGGPDRDGPKLDWVICGGETGPGARWMDLGWALDLRDQCQAAGVPFFYKGAGTALMPKYHPCYRMLNDRKWEQFPETPLHP